LGIVAKTGRLTCRESRLHVRADLMYPQSARKQAKSGAHIKMILVCSGVSFGANSKKEQSSLLHFKGGQRGILHTSAIRAVHHPILLEISCPDTIFLQIQVSGTTRYTRYLPDELDI
jgi:hypothetical protein